MKLGNVALAASLLVSTLFGAGCSRNRQEAVILAMTPKERRNPDLR